jgi:hypothetical protein
MINKQESLKLEMESLYKRAKELAKEILFDENETEDASSYYYFQCGFIAGMNYQKKK